MSSTSFLEGLLQLPDAQLHHSLTLPAVHSVLLSLLSTRSSSSDRELLHLVVSRLSLSTKGTLDLALLTVYIKSYYLDNRELVERVVDDAFSTSLSLKQTFTRLVPTALEQELSRQSGGGRDFEALETLLTLRLAAQRHLQPKTEDELTTTSTMTHLDQLYTNLTQDETDPTLDPLRLLVLSTFASILTLPSYSLEQLDRTLRIAATLGNSRLVKDVETNLGVTKQLGVKVQGQVGKVAREVKDSIGKLKKSAAAGESQNGDGKGKGKEQEDWIARVRRKASLGVDESTLESGEFEDRGVDEEAEIVSTISSIQELLPHLSTAFLRIAIQHPSFRPSSTQTPISEVSERLVSALLENDLPKELQQILSRDANGPAPAEEPAEQKNEDTQEKTAAQRRNIFDEDKTFSRGKLLIPGSKGRIDPRQRGISLDERLKESIIALAEAPSSDEEGEEGEAFLDDSQEAGGAIKVGVRDNGEEDEEDDQETESNLGSRSGVQTPATPSTSGSANLFTPATIQLLEQTYLSSPSVFASDSLTRRTNKQRIKLREQTGLDDNQLEGWKRMLERGGEKQIGKMKDRIMDLNAKGNHPVAQTGSAENGYPGRSGSNANKGRGGSSRGGRGGGSSNRGKGDGGRAQHDRRKRGNDRKMAKMGATL
ncbi:hypothetical protein JCM5350_007677 [Sporobolomyces pararoseus]